MYVCACVYACICVMHRADERMECSSFSLSPDFLNLSFFFSSSDKADILTTNFKNSAYFGQRTADANRRRSVGSSAEPLLVAFCSYVNNIAN